MPEEDLGRKHEPEHDPFKTTKLNTIKQSPNAVKERYFDTINFINSKDIKMSCHVLLEYRNNDITDHTHNTWIGVLCDIAKSKLILTA